MKLIKINNEYKTITGNKVFADYYTLTINPTPFDATVTFDKGTVVGNTCTVLEGSSVTYTVSKTGYATKTGSVTITNNKTVNVTIYSGIQMYGYTATNNSNITNLYMFGNLSTDGYCAWFADRGGTITSITGTIGSSGSKLVLSSSNPITYTYNRKITVGNRDIYIYRNFDFLMYEAGVFGNAVVGDSCIWSGLNVIKHPYSVSTSQLKYDSNSTIAYRNATLDYIFTGK